MENRIVKVFHKGCWKCSRLLKQSKGMTMIELVITMLLLSLFATGICQILATSIRTYQEMRALQESQEVSATILDKICGEIESAQPSFETKQTADGIGGAASEKTAGTLALYENHTKLFMIDRLGSKIWIGTKTDSNENKYLNIYYYPIKEKKDGTESIKYEAVDWKYDPKTYMGFSVNSLIFDFPGLSQPSEYPANLVHVTLELTNKSGNVFKAERYVECYNFRQDHEDFQKIKDHGEEAVRNN